MTEVPSDESADGEAEELSALRAELRHAREDLERLSYFVSHDLRAPLRHITSFGGLLEDELKDHDNQEVLAWLGFMSDGAHLVQRLLDEVLAFSRAQRAVAKAGVTEVAKMFADLEAHASVPQAGLVIGSQIDADVVVGMPLDHAKQAFAHLIRNAIHFRKNDSAAQISLAAKRDATRDQWEIEMRDEGVGIEGLVIGQVFDAFYRTSESARESPGLGLTVARKLVSLYGGSVGIESEPGAFTLVRVRLPAA